MHIIKLLIIVLIVGLFGAAILPKKNPSCREIVARMLDSVKTLKTQRCDVKAIENIKGRLHIAESSFKVNYNPKKIYFKNSKKGNEALWVHGENKGNARIHAPALPLVNFDLDPYGSLMHKDNHHTIFDLGFQFIGSIIANVVVKSQKDFDKHFAYAGTVMWDHVECYQIIISFPDYKYVEHTVLKGENVNSIGKKYSASDYKIHEKNDIPNYYSKIKEGKKILVPVPYGNKVIMLIDKKNYMPVNVKIYDENGLFEAYEFTNVKVNMAFAPDEFSVKFKGYGF